MLTKGKSLFHLDLSPIIQVTFIPNQYLDDTGVSLRAYLLHPSGYAFKTFSISYIINEHGSDGILEIEIRY